MKSPRFKSWRPVAGRRSIADLFPASKPRCGLYALKFADDSFYIGQAVDVVRRFHAHRVTWSDIVELAFEPIQRRRLNVAERDRIHSSELTGVRLRNIVHMSEVAGERDFDLLMTQPEQEAWLAVDSLQSSRPENLDPAVPAEWERTRLEAIRAKPRFDDVAHLLARYLVRTVPSLSTAERTFWSLTCLPSTNASTYPRLAVVNMNLMETLVVGHQRRDTNAHWAFMSIAASALDASARNTLRAAGVEIDAERKYRAGGVDQVQLRVEGLAGLATLLDNTAVLRGARLLNLRLMRLGATRYAKYHSFLLARHVLGQ